MFRVARRFPMDAAVDYYGVAEDSYDYVNYYSNMMTRMKEPVIYNDSLQEDESISRFSIFPSFHASVTFRVTKSKKKGWQYKSIGGGIQPFRTRDFVYFNGMKKLGNPPAWPHIS